MLSFPDMLTVLANQQQLPQFDEVNRTLIHLKNENPSQLLSMCLDTLNDESIEHKVKAYATNFITTLIKIDANAKIIRVAGPTIEELGSELLAAFFEELATLIYSDDEALSLAAANTLGHFKIYEYLSLNNPENPHPALEFAGLITQEASVRVCDLALVIIQYSLKIIKNIKRKAMEQILEIIIGRLTEGETDENYKLLFVDIASFRLDILGGRIEDGDPGVGYHVLSAIDSITEAVPQDVIWFWSEVASRSYELLRLAADLPTRIFEIIDTVSEEFAENAKIRALNFWNAVAVVEHNAIKHNLQFVVGNIEQILNFIIHCVTIDNHKDPIYINDETLGSAAVKCIVSVVKLDFEDSYNVLQPFVIDNVSSEDLQVRTAAAIALRGLLSNAATPESVSAMAEFTEDVINALLQDESPRVLNMAISCLSSAVTSKVVPLTEEIISMIGELALSGVDHVMENSVITLGQFGKSDNEGAADAAAEALFTIALQNANEAISSSALRCINHFIGKLSNESKAEVFGKAMEIAEALLESSPESPSLGDAVCVMNTVLNHLKQESASLAAPFVQLCLHLLDTPSAAPAVNGIGVIVFFFGREDAEILEAAQGVVLAKIGQRDEPEVMKCTMRLAVHIIYQTQSPELQGPILEAVLPMLADDGLDTEALVIVLQIIDAVLQVGNFYDEVRAHVAAVLNACNKIYQTSSVQMMRNVFEIVVALRHVVEPGTEDDFALSNAAVTFIRMMSSHPASSSAYPEVLVDTLFYLFERNEELFAGIRGGRAFRYIITNAQKSTDEVTQARIAQMKAYQPQM